MIKSADHKMARTAVVTGGSSGIGKSIVVTLLKAGINVISIAKNYSNSSMGIAIGENISTSSLQEIALDVRDAYSVEKVFEEISIHFGSIDYLIVNAGVLYEGTIQQLHTSKFDEMIDVNIKGSFNTVKGALPYLCKERSSIVFIGSADSLSPSPLRAVYAGTKSWLRNFALSLQGELYEKNVMVTIINPSKTNTKMANFKDSDHIILEPSEIAECVLFAIQHTGKGVIQEINLFRPNKWAIRKNK